MIRGASSRMSLEIVMVLVEPDLLKNPLQVVTMSVRRTVDDNISEAHAEWYG